MLRHWLRGAWPRFADDQGGFDAGALLAATRALPPTEVGRSGGRRVTHVVVAFRNGSRQRSRCLSDEVESIRRPYGQRGQALECDVVALHVLSLLDEPLPVEPFDVDRVSIRLLGELQNRERPCRARVTTTDVEREDLHCDPGQLHELQHVLKLLAHDVVVADDAE